MNKLKKDAFMGVLWKGGSSIFHQVMLLIVKLVLVRLLIPEEFGLAALAFILVSSLSIINAIGTGTAFVRDQENDQFRAKNTLFYLDAVAVLLIAIIGFFGAPLAVKFFAKNITDPTSLNTLLWMFRFVALSQLVGILTIVPGKILAREIRVKESVFASSAGTLVYTVLAIFLAYSGMGAWSIIIAQIANVIISKLIIFFYVPFIPSLVFDFKIAKQYIKFGSNNFINSVLGMIIGNGDDVLIGRLFGSAAIGLYSLGQHFAGLVVSIVAGVISSVAFPILSKLQKDKETYVRAFFKIYRLKNMFVIPSILGSLVLADWIILIVFGENWMPMLPIFYVLSIASFFNHLVALAEPVLNSLNKPHILRNNKLIQFGFFIVLIYPFTKMWGIVGTSAVFIVFSLVALVYLMPYLAREIPGFYAYVFKVSAKALFASLIMAVVVYSVKIRLSMSILWLIVLVLIGVAVYFIMIYFLDKENLTWDFQEVLVVLKEKFSFLR